METVKVAVEILGPVVQTLLIAALGVYVPILARKISVTLNIADEAMVRDALHAAAERGIKYAQQRLGLAAGTPALIAEATAYVRQNNPDSLKKLSVDDAQLTSILKAKLR